MEFRNKSRARKDFGNLYEKKMRKKKNKWENFSNGVTSLL